MVPARALICSRPVPRVLHRLRGRLGLLGALGALGGLGACRDAPPPGVTDLRIEDPLAYHQAEGFTPLVPPAHLPSSSPERDQVEIWVRLPDGATIDAQLDPAGRPTLEFPPGTRADRVEFAGRGDARRIVDIRGTRLEDDGRQVFYVLRPTGSTPRSPLFGVEWARDDAAAHEAATDRLVAKLAEVPAWASMPADRRRRQLDGVRAKNRCAGCHALGRPDNTVPREHGIVDRGTDRSGFHTPQTVLRDEVALEAYGGHDRSWSDPSLEIRCGGEPLAQPAPGARRCPDGSIATARLRWDAREPAAKAHLEQVCESRRFLLAHMTPENRAKMARAAGPCQES